jgi:hypothetical protein
MAVRQQDLTKVMHGRIQAFQVQQTGSEVIYLNKIKTGNVNVTEEIKQDVTELIDGQEVIEEYGRKAIAEITYDEVNETDINSINNGDWFAVETESGGTNGTGQTITISGSDSVQCSIDGIRTKVLVEKSVSTGLAYTITDNA